MASRETLNLQALVETNLHETVAAPTHPSVMLGSVFSSDTGSDKLIPPSPERASDSTSSVKLDTYVVNLQRKRDALWERIGDKLAEVHHQLTPETRRQFENYSRCGKEIMSRTCSGCSKCTILEYQCSVKWCPRCVWKLSKTRQHEMAHWCGHVTQPKHVVVTQMNFGMLSRQDILNNTRNVRALQRSKCFEQVAGGCSSTEITNKSRGWHLHNHLLVDARWIDNSELARTWGKLVGQQFAIVKVKDAREKDYRAEVAKYVVKSSELAGWRPDQIAAFVNSIYRTRMFVRFGTLRDCEKPPKESKHRVCECGCCEFRTESEVSSVLREILKMRGR